MRALDLVADWPVGHAAAGVVEAGGEPVTTGGAERLYMLASVSKLLTAVAVLVAVEEGTVDLDEPAGPPDATVRHLLAHTSGLPFDSPIRRCRPGSRRIYSNSGFDLLGAHLAAAADMPFATYVDEAVFAPLGMSATGFADDPGAPSKGATAPLADVLRFARELLAPTLLAPSTLAEATSTQFPGLAGVVPGIGRMDPCDWGLGFELRDGKSPHWTGRRNSPATFGHFGGSGTFLWVDPEARIACAALADRPFDTWAMQAWPALSDAVLAERAG